MRYWTKDILIDPNDATQSTWYVCVYSGWGGPPNGLGGLYRRDYGRSHGTGLADALIAATSEENGADLVTFNRRHFPMVSRLVVPYER